MKTSTAFAVAVLSLARLFAVAQETAPQTPMDTITGSGSAHYIPALNGSTTIQDSTIYETFSGNVGIETTSRGVTLDVTCVLVAQWHGTQRHQPASAALEAAARQIGAPWVSWHTFRTHATLLQMAGGSIKDAQAQLGHAQSTTTLDLYTILIPAHQRAAVEKLSQLVTNGDQLALRRESPIREVQVLQ